MLALGNVYYVYTVFVIALSSEVYLKFYNQDSNYITTLFRMSFLKTFQFYKIKSVSMVTNML